MTSADIEYRDRYPRLFAPQRWEWAGFDAEFSTAEPDPGIVTNVHVVGFVGERVVLCKSVAERWFLPGGTLEAGEGVEEGLARELREEAGARLTGPLRWIGAHEGITDHSTPYRPWQPHPRKAWLWCMADVVVDSAPTNPDDGEHVVEVRAVTVAEARELLADNLDFMPELVALAAELHLQGSGKREREEAEPGITEPGATGSA